MSETNPQALSGVAGTLLITLYIRAMESQRPDALLRDERAVGRMRPIETVFRTTRIYHFQLGKAAE